MFKKEDKIIVVNAKNSKEKSVYLPYSIFQDNGEKGLYHVYLKEIETALSDSQKEYAINDVKYLYLLWNKLHKEFISKGLEEIAIKCFEFIPCYKKITDFGIENIFAY